MLSGLRGGTPVYVLYKNEPRFTVAKVISVSNQYPQFNYNQPLNPIGSAAVDISIEVDGKTEIYHRIPLNSSIAEFPDKGVVISETRDGIINEINVIKAASQTAISQVDAHKKVVETCDNLLLELNPQLKRDQEQAGEIENLKQQISGMSDQIAALTGMISKSFGKKKEE